MQTPVDAAAHLGLVRMCAGRFRDRGTEYEELYSAGCLGLVKAANSFDPARGTAFSTYAVPFIMGEMRHLFRDGGTVRVGRQLYERGQQVSRACEKLRQELGREPAVSEIAAETGLGESDTAQALCAAQPVLSLTAVDESGMCTLDIPVPSHAEAVETHLALEQALSLLAPADRRLLGLRYRENLTQSAAAKELGMTQVQVSRREKKLLLFLREQLLP